MGSAILLTVVSGTVRANPISFDKAVLPFLREHCVRCHGKEAQEGNFRVDTIPADFGSLLNAQLWGEVVGRINSGEMPPEEESQPKQEELEQVAEWLSARIKEGERARMAQRGPVEYYRLSREEYAHTVYDLLGVHYDTKAPGAFSEDPEWQGFERVGSQLSLSPSHVEKYFASAEAILETAFPDREVRTRTYRKEPLDIDWPNRPLKKQLEEAGLAGQVRTLIWADHRLSHVEPAYRLDHPGIYRAKLKLSGVTPKGGRIPHVAIYSKTLERMIFEADVLAPEKEPIVLEFETFLPAGQVRIEINNEVPGPSNAPSSGRPAGNFVFTTLNDPISRAPWQRKMTDDDGNPLYPLLIFDSIDWEGPITREEDLQKRTQFFPTQAGNMEQVRDCLTRFATRAWRRPVTDVEIDRYMAIVEGEVQNGTPFRAAMKTGLLGILISQNFYYLSEGSQTEFRDTLNDWELASRLSYFLWSSLPDEELQQAAQTGTLRQPDQLRAQVRRMMADPKISRFTDSFPRQWLQLKKVGMFPPDEKLYPDYDPWLEKSMVLESVHYFTEVFNQNLSLSEFLDSDWSVINPRLALHYGLPSPESPDFTRVMFRPEDHRGGLLTHASALSLTSDGTRHRPVHRGVWVSEVILGKTPNPPPPNVEPIEPNPVNEPKATIRMKIEAHTVHAHCAACHKKIDPLGFAFNNYDAIGRWQTEEQVSTGKGANPSVDASGMFPDGRRYAGPEEFKQLLRNDLDQFRLAFVEKLATYGLRRAMTIDDRDHLAAIARETEKHNDRLRDLVEDFILSDLFQKR